MKIYYAHSMSDFRSKYETICTNYIVCFCEANGIKNFEIVNPSDIKLDKISIDRRLPIDEFMEKLKFVLKCHFYPIIDGCDVIVFFPNKDYKWTLGVLEELKYSLKKEKHIVIFENVFSNLIGCKNNHVIVDAIRRIRHQKCIRYQIIHLDDFGECIEIK